MLAVAVATGPLLTFLIRDVAINGFVSTGNLMYVPGCFAVTRAQDELPHRDKMRRSAKRPGQRVSRQAIGNAVTKENGP
jgi:hypothetical protein